jgi:hypothetical protein
MNGCLLNIGSLYPIHHIAHQIHYMFCSSKEFLRNIFIFHSDIITEFAFTQIWPCKFMKRIPKSHLTGAVAQVQEEESPNCLEPGWVWKHGFELLDLTFPSILISHKLCSPFLSLEEVAHGKVTWWGENTWMKKYSFTYCGSLSLWWVLYQTLNPYIPEVHFFLWFCLLGNNVSQGHFGVRAGLHDWVTAEMETNQVVNEWCIAAVPYRILSCIQAPNPDSEREWVLWI